MFSPLCSIEDNFSLSDSCFSPATNPGETSTLQLLGKGHDGHVSIQVLVIEIDIFRDRFRD